MNSFGDGVPRCRCETHKHGKESEREKAQDDPNHHHHHCHHNANDFLPTIVSVIQQSTNFVLVAYHRLDFQAIFTSKIESCFH